MVVGPREHSSRRPTTDEGRSYEETFCSYHARKHGLAVIYFGPVVITHLWHRASDHGGEVDRKMGIARDLYRKACAAHGIACE